MTAVRVFRPENRLRAVLGDPYAPTTAELAAAAGRNVAKMGPELRGIVHKHGLELARLARRPEAEVLADSDALGAAALGICEVAGACGLPEAGEAAKGVYAMASALRATGVWHTGALNAHVDALVLLTGEPAPEPVEARQILDRLSGVRSFLGVQV